MGLKTSVLTPWLNGNSRDFDVLVRVYIERVDAWARDKSELYEEGWNDPFDWRYIGCETNAIVLLEIPPRMRVTLDCEPINTSNSMVITMYGDGGVIARSHVRRFCRQVVAEFLANAVEFCFVHSFSGNQRVFSRDSLEHEKLTEGFTRLVSCDWIDDWVKARGSVLR